MLKTTTTLLLVLCLHCSLIYAQDMSLESIGKRTINPNMVSKGLKSTKQAKVTINSDMNYVPGAELDMWFTMNYTTSDGDYGDSLRISFPEGLTPVSGSNPIAVASEGQASENLNPILGQAISWGDNDNSYGGIQPGVHKFFIRLKVDANLVGTQTVNWYMSTDEYGEAPNFDQGSFEMQPLPSVPDLEVTATGFVAEYFAVPFDQAKFTVDAKVRNIGATLNSETKVQVSNLNGYTEELSIELPLLPYEAKTVSFKGFEYKGESSQIFIIEANAVNDLDPTNGIDTSEIAFNDSMLIRDNGEIIGAMGISSTQAGGILGNIFKINAKDTLNSIAVFLVNPTFGDKLTAVVYSMQNGQPYREIATSAFFSPSEGNKEYIAYFADNGMVIEPGEYLIGLREGVHNMSLAVTSTDYTEGTTWGYFNNKWNNLGEMGYRHTYYIRPGFGTTVPNFDIALNKLEMYQYNLKDDQLIVKGYIENKGITTLEEVKICYQVDEESPVVEIITPALSGQSFYNFSFKTKIDLNYVNEYKLKVYISEPNGIQDANLNNDTLNMLISAMEYSPAKRVVGEEATGSWCGWCVRGHVFMEQLAHDYPNEWIGIAVHNNDPMVVSEYDSGIKKYIAGYPSGLVDRSYELDPSEFEEALTAQIKKASPVDLKLGKARYNAESRLLSFDIEAEFLATVKNARFNAVIIENNVSGTSEGYNQRNYYSGGTNGKMGGYENLPDPVLAADMVYQNVARAILGGWEGTKSSLPEIVNLGESKSYTYEVTLKPNWKFEEIELVAMVIGENGEILNGAKSKINIQLSIKDESINKVYPNPFDSELTITDLTIGTKVDCFNILNQNVMSFNVTNTTMVLNLGSLPNGLYMVKIVDGIKLLNTMKVIKQ